MLIACNNKGCMQTSNALLNKDTHEVVCGECGKAISGVSDAMRRTLSSFGQILRTDSRKAFMMACRNCNANREIVLADDNSTVCSICTQPVVVHAAMKAAILDLGKKLHKDNDESLVDDTAESQKPKKTRKKQNKTSEDK